MNGAVPTAGITPCLFSQETRRRLLVVDRLPARVLTFSDISPTALVAALTS